MFDKYGLKGALSLTLIINFKSNSFMGFFLKRKIRNYLYILKEIDEECCIIILERENIEVKYGFY